MRLLALLSILACGSKDTGSPPVGGGGDDTGVSDDTGAPSAVDNDHDGYDETVDCNDDDPGVHPDAMEIPYDGIDQDCNGADVTDVDGDGWDAEEVGGEDCDDDDASVNPDAYDSDNGVDDNCDGRIDENAGGGAVDWPATAGGEDATAVVDAVAASSTMVFALGRFEGKVDFDPRPDEYIDRRSKTAEPDLFLWALSASREARWVVAIKGDSTLEAGSVAVDPGGDPLVAGSFEGSIDVDDAEATYVFEARGGLDGFVARYGADSGALYWGKAWGGDGDDRVMGACGGNIGEVYAVGAFQGSMDLDPANGADTDARTAVAETAGWVVALDASGSYLWGDVFDGQQATDSAQVDAVLLDAAGDLVVTGHFSGTVDLDPGDGELLAESTDGGQDVFVVALDASAGGMLWGVSFGGAGDEVPASVAEAPGGGVVVGGGFTGSGVDGIESAGEGDGLVVALDGAHTVAWAQALGGIEDDAVAGVVVDEDGGVWAAGRYRASLTAGETVMTAEGESDCFVAQLDAVGVPWILSLGDTADAGCGAPALDGAGGLFFGSAYEQMMDFGLTGDEDLRVPDGEQDAWVHRWGI